MVFLFKNLSIFQIYILLSVLFPVCHCDKNKVPSKNDITYYISGGTIIDKYDFGKYMVSIQLKKHNKKFGWLHFCGGSIISKNKILTAAHCLMRQQSKILKPYEIEVVVGLRNRFTRTTTTRVKDVAYVGVHHLHGLSRTMFADIGYLILNEDIVFDNPQTQIIKLADQWPDSGQWCTVIGWGRLFDRGPMSDELEFVDVKLLSDRDCKRRYRSLFTLGMLCAADPDNWKKDSCTGDSGGPLICDRKLVGVVSWGIQCGLHEFPGVYTDVYYFKSWIAGNGKQRLYVNRAVILIFPIKLVLHRYAQSCLD